MSKLRVGIIVYADSHPTEGGGHTYYHKLLKGINTFTFSPDIEVVNIVFYKKNVPALNLQKKSLYIRSAYKIDPLPKEHTPGGFRMQRTLDKFFYKFFGYFRKKKIERILIQNNIDLVYYLKPESHVLNYPFIATHWDVGHKSMHAFPEVSMNGMYESREKYYLYTLNKAFVVLCESETGARELIAYYPEFINKVKVFPVFGGDIISLNISETDQQKVLEKYKLEEDKFFVYPAQFWAHKNHYNLVLAFHKLVTESKRQDLKLVLCGSDKGNKTYITQVVRSLSLQDYVLFPGFVRDDELFVFYKNAVSLVMPTFLGPTNLPLIEAAHLNCAILCSDLEGHREILGDNALYFNPADPVALTDAMRLILDSNTRLNLMRSAKKHIAQSPFDLDKSLPVLNQIFTDTTSKRKAWGINYSIVVQAVTLALSAGRESASCLLWEL